MADLHQPLQTFKGTFNRILQNSSDSRELLVTSTVGVRLCWPIGGFFAVTPMGLLWSYRVQQLPLWYPFGGVQTLFAFIQPVGVGEATVTIAGVPAYWYCANSAYVNRHIVILLCNFSGLMIYETEPINLCSLLSTTVRNVALTQARHLLGQVFTGHRLDSQWKWQKTL